MNSADLFFVIFFLLILGMRILLWFRPRPSPTIKGLRLHHYMYGIIIAPIGAILGNVWIYAIGWALFIDEIGFILTNGKNHKDNYSWKSLLILILFVIGFYFLRDWIVFF